MRLVIFDVDGTLTQTMETDAECFVRSLDEVCGFSHVETDWSRYRHATDSGVFQEIYESRTGRLPSSIEISAFRQHFVGLLAQVSSRVPFAPVTGAPVLLSRLAANREHRVAFATGAWRDGARLKMRSAGLCYDDYPAASSELISRQGGVAFALSHDALFTCVHLLPFLLGDSGHGVVADPKPACDCALRITVGECVYDSLPNS